jgi:8-oxo-dGTP diphosphatase
MIYLVSHAHSLGRGEWDLADHLRPLSPRGWRQSVALAMRMSGIGITAVVASPTHRGVQTVSGLALRRRLSVVTDPRLDRGVSPAVVVGLVGEQPDGAVLCTFGSLVSAVLAELHRRGVAAAVPVDPALAGVWALRRSGGAVAAAGHRPPAIPVPRTENTAAPFFRAVR